MAIKDVVCILDIETDLTTATVQIANELASQMGAHLTGVAPLIEPIVPALMVQPVPDQFITDARNRAKDKAESAIERFAEYAEVNGTPFETRILDIMPGGLDTLLNHARMCDLIVIGQDHPDRPEPLRADLIEAALFDSGRPILLVPYVGVEAFSAKKILVAWDGSKTSAHAVYAAMSILEKADEVQVVMVDAEKLHLPGDPGADLAVYLSRHGVNVTVQKIPSTEGGASDALVRHIEANGNDLVVMGGYGHSRVREFILGGVTRDMLDTMPVPCLMAH
ncbi:universal stress protein [Cohaesibacter haloalkalitolerans]|uniref:universal stress protein n=1 Tax=Cohaesibacter haloalkalitolerans TaxID=1162980 RepID=UPI000E6557BC|nr:universal stress protein [Cohaesibacter haloalkalitolerans]